MKKLVLTLALGVACFSAFAQGTVNFANVGAGVNAPIYLSTVGGTKLDGATYVAQLYAGAAGSTEAQLTAVGALANFLSGAQAGYFTGGSRTIPGVAGGSSAVLQVRVWNAAAGATWEAANLNSTAWVGKSGLVTVSLTVPPSTPPNMVGLTSFAIVPVPEPSTFALAGLGAAAMLIFRRRK